MPNEEGGQIVAREGQERYVEGDVDNRRLYKKLVHVESLLEEMREEIESLKGTGSGGRHGESLELVEVDGEDWRYTDVGARLVER